MKKTGLLIKFELMQLLAPLRKENIRKNLLKNIGIGLVLFLSFGILVGMIVFLEIQLLEAFAFLKLEQLILAGIILLSMIVTTFFGFLRGISLFLTKDKESLAALPITSKSIFTAKVISNIIAYLGISFLFFLPCTITYGVCTGQQVLFYIFTVVVSVLVPIIPVVLATFIAGLLSSSISKVKKKERWLMILSFIFIIAMVAFPLIFTDYSASEELDMMALVQLISNNQALLEKAVGWFPPALWATGWLSGNMVDGIKFILLSVASFVLLIGIFGNGYQKKILAMDETAQKKKKGLRVGIYKQKSPVLAVFFNEWKQVLRSAVYALNGLAGVIMFPLMIGVLLIGGQRANFGDITFVPADLLNAVPSVLFMWIAALIFVFCGMANTAGATVVSREGKFHDYYKLFPAKPWQLIMGKQWFNFSIPAIASGISAILLSFAFPSYGIYIALGLLLGLAMNYILSAIALMVDVVKPKFDWKTETQVIKQSANAMIQMVIYLVVLIVFGFLTYFLYKTGINLTVLSLMLSAAIAVGVFVVQKLLCDKMANIYVGKETN